MRIDFNNHIANTAAPTGGQHSMSGASQFTSQKKGVRKQLRSDFGQPIARRRGCCGSQELEGIPNMVEISRTLKAVEGSAPTARNPSLRSPIACRQWLGLAFKISDPTMAATAGSTEMNDL